MMNSIELTYVVRCAYLCGCQLHGVLQHSRHSEVTQLDEAARGEEDVLQGREKRRGNTG